MDRGVKIAIFVASIVSLGLGLVWDQVLNHAREIVAEDKGDGFTSEKLRARIGPKELQRQEIPTELAADNTVPKAADKPAEQKKPEDTPAPSSSDMEEYVVQSGDSPSRICYRTFKERNLQTKDLYDANPSVDFTRLQPGMKIKVPKQGTKKPG